jgi:predicted acyltransferase
MIVVNTPGTWAHVYPPLLHAEWHGWTFTDTIFPFFLFIVGVSMAISFDRRRAQGASRRELFLHSLRRGVLAVAFALLLGYWAVMAPSGYERETNFASQVDRLVLGSHTWKPGWDPEGPLSTIPAVATTLLGALAGEWLVSPLVTRKIAGLVAGGAIALAAGALWGRVFPINKNLWTSSYSLFMSGLAAIFLALCLWIVDVKGWKAWARPFEWLGRNAIAAFVASTLGTILLLGVKVAGPEGKPRSLYTTIYRTVFDRFADPRLGSLLFALAYLAVWIGICGLLYRRRIFLKV